MIEMYRDSLSSALKIDENSYTSDEFSQSIDFIFIEAFFKYPFKETCKEQQNYEDEYLILLLLETIGHDLWMIVVRYQDENEAFINYY